MHPTSNCLLWMVYWITVFCSKRSTSFFLPFSHPNLIIVWLSHGWPGGESEKVRHALELLHMDMHIHWDVSLWFHIYFITISGMLTQSIDPSLSCDCTLSSVLIEHVIQKSCHIHGTLHFVLCVLMSWSAKKAWLGLFILTPFIRLLGCARNVLAPPCKFFPPFFWLGLSTAIKLMLIC